MITTAQNFTSDGCVTIDGAGRTLNAIQLTISGENASAYIARRIADSWVAVLRLSTTGCDTATGAAFVPAGENIQLCVEGASPTNCVVAALDELENVAIPQAVAAAPGAVADGGVNTVAMDAVCANVGGAPMYVYPLVSVDTSTGQVVSVVYTNEFGDQITGEVTAAAPCDCPCPDCP